MERSIGLSARVTQTGTYVNSRPARAIGKDTNGANNTDVRVDAGDGSGDAADAGAEADSREAAAEAEAEAGGELCRVLKVTPGLVKANGKNQLVVARVTRSRTPVAGCGGAVHRDGLDKVVKTNRQGVARISVKPGKAGIMLVRITSVKACNSARIGVVGVFEPPVTG